jgi:hypothetical protein
MRHEVYTINGRVGVARSYKAAYGVAILVVREAAGKSVLERSAKGPGFDFWDRGDAHPNAVLGSALSIILDYRIPVFFCGTRQAACQFTQAYLLAARRRWDR